MTDIKPVDPNSRAIEPARMPDRPFYVRRLVPPPIPLSALRSPPIANPRKRKLDYVEALEAIQQNQIVLIGRIEKLQAEVKRLRANCP
jgi:hypothetical protein